MSGFVWRWGQADRRRGGGWSFAHLFPRDAETGLDEGHQARCGYDPTHGTDGVVFRAAPEDAPRCSRCERGAEAVRGHVYYPLGEHPADLARDGR